MWILIIIGGGIAVVILGPIQISGYSQYDSILSSGIKAIIAIAMVVIWIFILSKIKNWIFQKELEF
jgi:mannose/fructose/N-acetylgalactosamine-specific phosphotransferase system component IIC